jgi:hypothetical protein
LENPYRPPSRIKNRIETNGGSVHTDESDRSVCSAEGAALDGDRLRLVAFPPRHLDNRRAEERFTRTAANVDAPLSRILETAPGDLNVRASPLRLDAIVTALPERAVDDHAPVAADHVNRRTAPPFDGALLHPKVVETGELDSIVIAFRQVRNVDISDDDVMRRGVEGASIVDVQTVTPGAPDP